MIKKIGYSFLFLLIAIALTLTSIKGNRLIISTYSYFNPDLEMTLTSGLLFYKPEIENLRWKNEFLTVQIDHANVVFKYSCLFTCLDELTIKNLNVFYESTADTEISPPPNNENLHSLESKGLTLTINKATIESFTYKQEGTDIDIGQSTLTHFKLADKKIYAQGMLGNININYESSAEGDTTLPQLDFPYPLIFTNVSSQLVTINYNADPYFINDITTNLHFFDDQLDITNSQLSYNGQVINAQGTLLFSGGWPMDINIESTDNSLGYFINGNMKGALSNTQLNFSIKEPLESTLTGSINLLTTEHNLNVKWQEKKLTESLTLAKDYATIKGDLNNFSISFNPNPSGNHISLNGSINGNLDLLSTKKLNIYSQYGTLNIDGQLSDLTLWTGILSSQFSNFNEQNDQIAVKAVHQYDIDLNKLSASRIDINGTYYNQPLELNTAFTIDSKKIDLKKITGKILNGNFTASSRYKNDVFITTLQAKNVNTKIINQDFPLINTLSVPIYFKLNNRLSINNAQVVGEFTGLSTEQFSADFSGNIYNTYADISQLNINALKGSASLIGKLNFKNNLQWQGLVNVNKISTNIKGSDLILSGDIAHSVTLDNDHWQAQISKMQLDGQLSSKPLLIKGELFADSNQHYQLNNLLVSNGVNSININGSIKEQLNLNAIVNIKNLKESFSQYSGAADGSLVLSGNHDKPIINFDVNANDILVDQLYIERLKAKGVVSKKSIESLAIESSNLVFNEFNITQFNILTDRLDSIYNVNATLISNFLEFTLQANAKEQTDGWLATINKSTFEQKWINQSDIQQTWTLKKPENLFVNQTSFSIPQTCWQQLANQFCLSGQKDSGGIKLLAALKDYQLKRLQPLLSDKISLEGTANAQVNLLLDKSDKIHTDLNIQSSNTTLNQRLIESFKLSLNIDDTLQGRLSTQLTSTYFGNANVNIKNIESMNSDIKFDNIRLANINQLYPFANRIDGNFSGHLKSDANLQDINTNGFNKDQLNISGQLNLTIFSLRDQALPIDITKGELNLLFKEDHADVSGNIFAGGSADLTGRLNWQNELNSSFKFKGQRLLINYQNQAKLRINPDINIELSPENIHASGLIDVDEGSIKLRQLQASAVGLNNDVYLVDEQIERATPFELPYSLAFVTNLNQNLTIDALGLKGKLAGSLAIDKTLSGPVNVNGEIDLTGNTYSAYGQDLIIETGKVQFTGPVSSPSVDINAIRNKNNIEDDVTAGILLTGNINKPTVTLYSNPVMNQQNVLSYLLRGKNLTSDEQDQDSISNLLLNIGLSQGATQIEQLGQSFGINDLAVSSTGNGDLAQVSVSGYVMPGMQLEYARGLFSSINVFALRYQVFPKLYIEASNGLGQAIDLFYEIDFE